MGKVLYLQEGSVVASKYSFEPLLPHQLGLGVTWPQLLARYRGRPTTTTI